MNILLLPLGALAAAAGPVVPDPVGMREVRYYDRRFFDRADVPFSLNPPERLLASVVTPERVRQVLEQRDILIEDCPLIRDQKTGIVRAPSGYEERKRYCDWYVRAD